MPDVISDYQKWKHQGDSLRVQAKQAMEVRYRELLQEAAAIAEEYRLDFGGSLKPPSPVTAPAAATRNGCAGWLWEASGPTPRTR